MTYEIVDPSFSEISAVFYYQGSGSPKLELYKAGTERLDNLDFLETDFKFFQDKLEFVGSDVLGYFDDTDKTIINGRGIAGIEKYLSTLFPTVISGDYRDSIKGYFSSYIGNLGDELFCFLIPEGINHISLVDNTNESSDTAIYVYFDDTEIEFSKILWILTSYKSGNREIDLSWIAYQGDRNPNLEMSDYVLRNDFFVSDYMGYREENDFIYSENSVGDKARIGETVYESVDPDNIGNHPYYSRKWAVYDN